jgi:tetratricopeptide (TPR) repeat protein
MRYVPHLIPGKSKVLPDYFKGDIYGGRKKSKLSSAIGWIIGTISFIGAIASTDDPLLAVLLAVIGLLLIPPGHRFIEKIFRFRFTTGIKIFFLVALIIPVIPLIDRLDKVHKEQVAQQKTNEEREAKERSAADNKNKERKDSLAFYIQSSKKFQAEHKIDLAQRQLGLATTFATESSDKDEIAKERSNIASMKIMGLVKAGKYGVALPELSDLLVQNSNNPSLLYQRAICYSKTGKMQEAVNDCKEAMKLGSPEAEKLHEKINPLRKKVAYYVTRCCDGSTSSATGRGACSHHSGVCNWSEPVYEEYRKYE